MDLDLRQVYEQPTLAHAFNVWVDIRAPLEMVFHYLTDGDRLSRWWAAECHSEPKPGGGLHCVWRDGEHQLTGEAIFRRFEPPTTVVWEWLRHNETAINCDGQDHRGMRWPAQNHFQLRLLEGGRTRLHLHDLGIGDGDHLAPLRDATGQGWLQSLERLKRSAEQHHRQRQIQRAEEA